MSGETLSDMMTANVVVIQPGSLYLRIGAGCDSSPVKVLHAIARRRRDGGRPYHDPLLVPQAVLSSQTRQGLEQTKQQGRKTRSVGTELTLIFSLPSSERTRQKGRNQEDASNSGENSRV